MITKETKKQIYNQNIGCKVLAIKTLDEGSHDGYYYKYGDIGELVLINNSKWLQIHTDMDNETWPYGVEFDGGYIVDWHLDDFLLIKKSFKLLTDEDAAVCAKILTPDISDEDLQMCVKTKEDLIEFLSDIDIEFDGPMYNLLFIFQYLQSKQYDIPLYFLNGKTLKDAGLAIYETEITTIENKKHENN